MSRVLASITVMKSKQRGLGLDEDRPWLRIRYTRRCCIERDFLRFGKPT